MTLIAHDKPLDVLALFTHKERPATVLETPRGPEQPTVEESRMPLRADATIPCDCEERFWDRVDVRGAEECWPWTGALNDKGYGRLSIKLDGKVRHIKSTHISLVMDGRPRPHNGHALHSCDNPVCVNPRHLRWGSNYDNVLDRMARGRPTLTSERAAKGVRHCMAKLTDEQVRLIRADEQNPAMLSEILGVSRKTIYDVKAGKLWKHVV